MLKRWLRCLPAGFLLAALVLLLLWLNQPRSISEVAGIEENTVFSVYTTAETPQRELMMAHPEREEIEPLLSLLESGTVRWKGVCRTITWETDQRLYHIYVEAYSPEGEWLKSVSLDLRSDGAFYRMVGEWGYLRYELSGCDMSAVLMELEALTGMA